MNIGILVRKKAQIMNKKERKNTNPNEGRNYQWKKRLMNKIKKKKEFPERNR